MSRWRRAVWYIRTQHFEEHAAPSSENYDIRFTSSAVTYLPDYTASYSTQHRDINKLHICRPPVVFRYYTWELTKNYSRTTCKRASVSPVKPWSDTRENRALLLLRHCWKAWRHCGTRGGHVTPPHSCVIQVFIAVAWQQAKRGDTTRGATRHDTEKTPLRLLLRNRGNMFRGYGSCMA
jgi:hypothetical protein